MKTVVLTALAALMIGPVPAPRVEAHPAPYRHYHRYEPPPRPPASRRPPAPTSRFPMFYLGFGGVGTRLTSGGDTPSGSYLQTGGGLDLFFGWRFNESVALDLSWATTFHDAGPDVIDFERGTLTLFTVDVRLYPLPTPTRIEPYFQAGMGFYGLRRDDDWSTSLTGPGLQLGGGLDIHLDERFTLGGEVLYRAGHLENRDATWGLGEPESDWFQMMTWAAHVRVNF